MVGAKRCGRWVGYFSLLVALSGLLFIPATAGATPTTKLISGAFTGTQVTGPSCTSPVGLCIHGTITGAIKGTFDLSASEIKSALPSGVVFIDGNSVVQSTGGNLFLAFAAAVNTNAGSDGEFSSLDEITDGTGTFGSTSGYLQLAGTFVGGVEKGTYTGKLVTP